MEKYQGVAITDGVNRKNHILPLNAIIKAYRDTCTVFLALYVFLSYKPLMAVAPCVR